MLGVNALAFGLSLNSLACAFSGDFFDDEAADKDDVEDDGEFGVEVV